jgi:hypothetical protein
LKHWPPCSALPTDWSDANRTAQSRDRAER